MSTDLYLYELLSGNMVWIGDMRYEEIDGQYRYVHRSVGRIAALFEGGPILTRALVAETMVALSLGEDSPIGRGELITDPLEVSVNWPGGRDRVRRIRNGPYRTVMWKGGRVSPARPIKRWLERHLGCQIEYVER